MVDTKTCKDGLVRSVTLKTSDGLIRERDIRELVLLEEAGQPSPTDVEHLGSLLEPSISSTGCNSYTGGTTREPDSFLLDACMLQRSNTRISESTDHLHKVLTSDKCSPKTSTIDDNLPNVSMLTDCSSNASKTTNQPPSVFMSTDYFPNMSGSTECPAMFLR